MRFAQVKVHIVTMDLQDIRAVESLVEGLPDDFREVCVSTAKDTITITCYQ